MKKIFLALGLILVIGITPCYPADQFDKTLPADDTLIPAFPAFQRTNNEAQDRLLATYREAAALTYNSASSITISVGSIVCSNSGGTVRRLRTNTAAINSVWTVTTNGLDTGSEESSTTYTVWGLCDVDATTFTVKLSKSTSAPSGGTYYIALGTFFNNSSSDIDRYKIYTTAYGSVTANSSGHPPITAIFDYGSSTSSFTSKTGDMKFAFGQSTNPFTISNLPFTTSSSYRVSCLYKVDVIQSQQLFVSSKTASSFTCGSSTSNGSSIDWIAEGY